MVEVANYRPQFNKEARPQRASNQAINPGFILVPVTDGNQTVLLFGS
jgi:hypothetical protein